MSHTEFVETDYFKKIVSRVEQEKDRQFKSDGTIWEYKYAKQFGIDVDPKVVGNLIYELERYYAAYKEWRELAESLRGNS